MTSRFVLLLSVLVYLPACSCSTDPVGTDAGGTDAPALPDSMSIDDAPPSDVPMDVRDLPDGLTPVDVGTDAPTADAAGVSVTIEDFGAYGNCKPLVPPDAIIANWTVVVAGATGTSADFVSGDLVFSSGARVPVEVDPDTFALTAGGASQAQSRVAGTDETNACDMCSDGVTLEAVYGVDGASFPVTATGNFSCAF